MTLASSSIHTSMSGGGISASQSFRRSLFVDHSRPTNLILPRLLPSRSVLTFSRRKKTTTAITSSNKKKKSLPHNDTERENDLDENAFEALFNMLEEDLKNDASIDDNDDEISEEDLAKLERELEEALGDDAELLGMFNSIADDIERDSDTKEEVLEKEEDDDEEETPVKLKNWQLRRLASALKIGRRKTNIKSLAAELCLDRAVVLELLRDPPPNLLMISAALPDKPVPTISEPESELMETVPEKTTAEAAEPEAKVKVPIHEMQSRWSAQKRLKKVHVETLERVYRKTKRPTNAMISSIVHVTNLPRKRVVKWFEDKRSEDGVPDHRLPYQRSIPQTLSSC